MNTKEIAEFKGKKKIVTLDYLVEIYSNVIACSLCSYNDTECENLECKEGIRRFLECRMKADCTTCKYALYPSEEYPCSQCAPEKTSTPFLLYETASNINILERRCPND